MRIVLVTPEYAPKIGGVGRSAARLSGNLTRAGHPTIVVTYHRMEQLTQPPAVMEEGGNGSGVKVVRIGPIASGVASAGPETRAFLKRQFVDTSLGYLRSQGDWDIVLSLGLVDAGFPGLAIAHGLGVPHVVSGRGADVGTELFLGPTFSLAQWVVERSASVTFVNEYLREIARWVFGADSRFLVIRNAVGEVPLHDALRRKALRREVRDQLGIPENAAVVGWTGTFRPKKGLQYLSDAFQSLARERDDVYLLVVGGPRSLSDRSLCPVLDHPEYQRKTRTVGLLEMNSDVYDFYHAMDVFAYPSLDDGMANAVLEALASTTPVVATDVFSDILLHGETALIVPRYDSMALAAAIGSLLDDRERAQRLVERAERHLRSACAPERETDAYLSLFSRVLERDGGPGK